jgi:hypothetical protein
MTEPEYSGCALATVSYPFSTLGSVFYVGDGGPISTDGQIYQWSSADGSNWNNNVVGDGNGSQGIQYCGMVALWWGTGGWPGEMPDTLAMNVFYVGQGGQICNWYFTCDSNDWSNGNWSNGPLSGVPWETTTEMVAPYGSGLAAAWWPNNTMANVFYLGGDLQIWNWFWNGNQWTQSPLWNDSPTGQPGQPGALEAGNGCAVAAAWQPNNTNANVFYWGADNQIWNWFWNGNQWYNCPLGSGQPVLGGTAGRGLAAVWRPNGLSLDVFYVGADGQIWDWYWDGNNWTNKLLASHPGEPANSINEGGSNTDLAVVWMPNAIDANVFYVGADDQIWTWSLDGSTNTWTNYALWQKSPLGVFDKPRPALDGVAATCLGATEEGSTWEFQLNVFYSAQSDNQIYSWYSWDGIHWTNRQL